jgi:hypothetical protein
VRCTAYFFVDIKYRITPSSEFSSEQKAANKRATIIGQKAVKNDLQIKP